MDSNKDILKCSEHIQIPADPILWVGKMTVKCCLSIFNYRLLWTHLT